MAVTCKKHKKQTKKLAGAPRHEAICIELPIKRHSDTWSVTRDPFMRGAKLVHSLRVSIATCASHVVHGVALLVVLLVLVSGIAAEHGDLFAELGHREP